jgi:hypothetical protein
MFLSQPGQLLNQAPVTWFFMPEYLSASDKEVV